MATREEWQEAPSDRVYAMVIAVLVWLKPWLACLPLPPLEGIPRGRTQCVTNRSKEVCNRGNQDKTITLPAATSISNALGKMRRSARKQHATAVPAEDVGKSKAKKERKTTKGKRKSRDEESEPHELEETQTTPRTSETSGVSVVDGGASVSAYVASCREKLHVLRERKQEQEQRTEVIVQETFGQIEAIINALMTTVQTGYTSARTHFDETSGQLEEGLDVHEQVESKLHAITAILLGSTE